MANIESTYKVKLKNGWRAIIYDAPWAYFKPGQEGVMITSDGKACETIDDEKDSIIVRCYPFIKIYYNLFARLIKSSFEFTRYFRVVL